MSAAETYRRTQQDRILDPRSIAALYAYFGKKAANQAANGSGTEETRTTDARDRRTRTLYEIAAYYATATHTVQTTDADQARELARCATADALRVQYTKHTARSTWRGTETTTTVYRWQARDPHWRKMTP